MSKIAYADKVALNSNSGIADINKCNATDMNEIKSVVNENDDRLTTAETKIIPIEKYLTATAGSNGDFKVNIPNTLETGMIVNITFPTATVSSANARLSIDNGATYKNIFVNKSQSLARIIQSNSFSLRYDGTQWQIKCECYSTAEQVVGIWTDGKPIYEKTIYVSQTISSSVVNNIAHGVSNMAIASNKKLTVEGAFIYGSSLYNLGCFANSTSYLMFQNVTDTNLVVVVGSNWNNLFTNGFIVIQYMKTTD